MIYSELYEILVDLQEGYMIELSAYDRDVSLGAPWIEPSLAGRLLTRRVWPTCLDWIWTRHEISGYTEKRATQSGGVA